MVENITLTNTVTKTTLELDKITTPNYILSSVDWGVVESTHHSYKYINQIGVYVTGTSLETRDVEIIGWIIADTEIQMTSLKSMLNRFVNPQQPIDLSYSTYVLQFLPNNSVKYSATVSENNEVICKFSISGYCPDPLFGEESETAISGITTTGQFHFPLTISETPNPPGGVIFGLREPSLLINIVNSGAVSVGMRIVFKATGALSNPQLINASTLEYFKINKDMVAGESIEIDTIIGEKKIQGTLNNTTSNYFKYRDLSSTWLQLDVGDNIFRYDADANSGNLEVMIYFTNKYLEVQECY